MPQHFKALTVPISYKTTRTTPAVIVYHIFMKYQYFEIVIMQYI